MLHQEQSLLQKGLKEKLRVGVCVLAWPSVALVLVAVGLKKTAVGKATQMVIDKAIVEIANSLKNVPIRGKVIKASGSKVYINLGDRNGVSPSTQFDVYQPGEELIDPDTGENLGSEITKRGAIKVSAVKEKFSIAEIISGQGFEKGYWVQE